MTKSLASIPVEKREAVILRRIRGGGGGNGYFAALDAARKLGISTGPRYVSKKKWDKGQKKAGQDFAKAMDGRAKLHQLKRKPSIKNTPRIKRG